MVDQVQQAVVRRVSRENRKPFGGFVQKLAYEPRKDFHRHWFNEIPGRIDAALSAGYTHVHDKEGRKVQQTVGTTESGHPLTAYLMEIPEEWYKEDMQRQQDKVDEMDQAIRRGTANASPGDGRYVPVRGITIKDK